MVHNTVVFPSKEDIRIVVCSKEVIGIPNGCTFCNLASGCNKAFKTCSPDFAKAIRKSYVRRGHDVMVSNCKCIFKDTEARILPQLYIERKDVIFSGGGDYENGNLREPDRPNAAC